MTQVEENGATSGPGLLATYAYDGLGRRTGIARAGGSGLATAYQYGANGLLSQLTQSLAGSAATTFNFAYNTAGQILTRQDTNGGYTARPAAVSSIYATNGLNQYTSATGVEQTYSGANSASLSYDPLGRLQTETATGSAAAFLYDGSQLVGEYGVNGQILNRYVMGPGTDEPLTWYTGAGTSSRAWYAADNAGSVIATADQDANSTATYDYGPYGELITSNGASAWGGSRYRYTGQIEVPGAQTYYYKARAYDPSMGRFYQTDPVGLMSDFNLYAYGQQDPINKTDTNGTDDDLPPVDANNNCNGAEYCENFSLALVTPVPGVTVTGHRINMGFLLLSFVSTGFGNQNLGFGLGSIGLNGGSQSSNASKNKTKNPCNQVKNEQGPAFVDFFSADAIAGYRITGSVGVFVNLRTGSGVLFRTVGGGTGASAGAGIQGGLYTSAADLAGPNVNVSGSIPALSVSVNFAPNGDLVGASIGPGTKGGVSGTVTGTTLFACHIGGT